MPAIALFSSAYARTSYGLPEARLVNMFIETSQAGPTRQAYLPRPQLSPSFLLGAGPVRAQYQSDGVFGGDIYSVSGGGIYRGSTLLYAVSAQGGARIEASRSQIAFLVNGLLYIYDGTAVTPAAQFKDAEGALPLFGDLAYSTGRFIYSVDGSDRFYWSDLSDGALIDGLSFATAEQAPDPIQGVTVVNGEIFFTGTDSTEMWLASSNADQPFVPTQLRYFPKGAITRESIVPLDNTVFWIGNDLIAYRAGQVAQRISTHGVESRFQLCATPNLISAFEYTSAGHAFFVVRVPGEGTFVYDVSRPNDEWAEWATYGESEFQGQTCVTVGGVVYIGDALSGQVFTLGGTNLPLESPLEKVVSGFIPLQSGVVRCDVIALQCVVGVGTPGTPDPQVQLRWSDDAGRTFTDWRDGDLGGVGAYQKKVNWRRLGPMTSPGRFLEFRCTDPVNLVVESASFNEVRP